MFLKRLCLLFSLVGTVFSTSFCITQSPCKCVMAAGQVIDLSSIGSQVAPSFYELPNEINADLYSYNPCFAFNSLAKGTTTKAGNKPCTQAAACVRSPGGSDGQPPEEHSIGSQVSAQFGTNIELDKHINYTVIGAKQTLTVKLVCNDTILHHLTVDTPETAENSFVQMTLTSKCACPNKCSSAPPPDEPSGLSTGSKLLIAFFTILLAYFIIGIVWNFCNGSQGVEVVPNLEFWNELPKLIIEGIAFTCSCCGKKKSYGDI